MEEFKNTKEENVSNNQFNNQVNVQNLGRKQKKKKHIFLKIILLFVIMFLAYKGVRYLGNSYAEKKLNSFMVSYPFIFNNNDNYKAITEDFKVQNTYKLDNKEYKVTWKSNNSCIKFKDDNATVNNTLSTNQKVKISANYSIFGGIGKASKTFDVIVLTKNKLDIKDVNVVDVKSVKNKSYKRNMKMTLTSKGDVAAMYGDFKQSVYTSDDCYTVLKAYQKNLGINPSCDFKLCDVMRDDNTTTYSYYLTINNYNIEDKKVYVSVDNNDNYAIESIKCNFDKDISKYPIAKPQSSIKIYNLLSNTYKRTEKNTIFAYKGYGYKTINNKNYLIGDYCMLYDNGEIHEVYVDIINGKIIKEVKSFNNVMEECTGIGVMGDTKTFDAYKFDENEYCLLDSNRKIVAYKTLSPYLLYRLGMNNIENLKDYIDSENVFVRLGLISSVVINLSMTEIDMFRSTYYTRYKITSETNQFNNEPVAVDGYSNIAKAYDYYKNHFNLISYDNKGSIINIYIDNKMKTDNASWYSDYKSFFINPVENLKYSFAKDSEVLGHEYTHAVFGGYSNSSGEEVRGLNEAYSDIFGICINGYTDWKISENEYDGIKCYVRDLVNINSPQSYFKAVKNKPAPEKYHDADWEAWEGEEHAIACMIGHIAYQMYNSGKFTNTELENIWYKSLTYGYNDNDTYVTCRQQVLQAMNDLNGTTFNGNKFSFSSEQRDLVRSFFDAAEIFDNTDSYECISDAVEGDVMKDDSDVHRFAIAMFPVGFIINKAPIYIFEECKSPSKSNTELVQKELNKYWNDIGGNDASNELAEYFGSREGNAIVYKQIPTWQMNVVEWWIGKTDTDFSQFIGKTFNGSDETSKENSEIIDTIKNFVFKGNTMKTTRYKFYDKILEQ